MDVITNITLTVLVYAAKLAIIYFMAKSLIKYGIYLYFNEIDCRDREYAEAEERIRRADINADIRSINRQIDEIKKSKDDSEKIDDN